MRYTILSASYANPENTAATLQTREAGAVIASLADTPDLWAAMNAAVQPAAYSAPLQVPPTVTRFQARAAMLQAGLLAQAEALIAQSDALTKLAWADAQDFYRTSPTLAQMAQAMNLTAQQLDELFITASGIEA